ncbi:helix-turn-helix domain-containing protein [Microbispora sp. NBC_01189]|uniref:helix-turn-helix domain-containing protein n=1 Tax=Microbispora sp. NBC_01189 TaxID=2903583 RepID=UPI002E0FB52F|nr:helix-turn-helix domain-containing protein [Microbispora sp. NBC_01189]
MITIDVPLWAARLRALRRGRLWSRRDLEERLTEAAGETEPGLPTDAVHAWEAGERRPDPGHAELLCRVFGVDEADLFVGPQSGTTLWHHLTGIPLMPGLFPEEEEERVGRAIERPWRADAGTVGYFEWVLGACSVPNARPADLVAALRPVFAGIEAFRRDARPSARGPLLALATRDAELISGMEHEAGDAPGARAWSDRAIREARETGDPLTEVFALIQRAELVDAAEPGEIVEAAVAARERTGLPAEVATLSRRHEARAHALAGEVELCHRCLEECLEEPGGRRAELHASCLVDLGRPGGAVELLEGEPAPAAPAYLAAYVLARKAHAYAEAHERDEAADLARRALVLARRAGAARALRELGRVHLPSTPEARRHSFV